MDDGAEQWKRLSCISQPPVSHSLMRMMPSRTRPASKSGASSRNFVAAKAEHALDAGAVIPRAIEHDHVAGRGKVLDIALEIPLAALGFGRLRQRYRRGHGADSNAA